MQNVVKYTPRYERVKPQRLYVIRFLELDGLGPFDDFREAKRIYTHFSSDEEAAEFVENFKKKRKSFDPILEVSRAGQYINDKDALTRAISAYSKEQNFSNNKFDFDYDPERRY